ncbi:MAG: D-alanine-D-alanine ligase [Candidatus Uhrbacteria bacterium GW2011_GWF2_41_16]|uniref:D-alanine--D-alanine ligase n=2 Tax=Candidatus Uhriibacteriota TaxID=1752732 RepID=A0A0G0VD17_9BACT|nr:MAG: D-alanine-D-alanine ligase [Candidatus Uhrbacteria bacterium GW2011_GWA2_41_10]KKR87840.1 MAG: D-alanine-D-alanine ligase [Candidatus Uhrbacteria bacterium GW2011_GWC2_41_11]KKR98779.1 MAG: D-alanine-D-alanine ligase [Candidatus Uhrbacteria bacterium GW2011_GWF2_41_16]HBP00378.1 D-alanine--D-alanine ligase [Candidatus Uhrbacteria bacterium]
MKNKKTIAVIFGGKSAEHDVSIITAHTPIIDTLLTLDEYEVIPIYITKEGLWYSEKQMNYMDYFKGDIQDKFTKLKPLQLSIGEKFSIVLSGMVSKKIDIDLVFPAMHGTYGEDGSLMGILRMANVPFVGCDMAASAVAMDKVLTKQVVSAAGLPVVRYEWLTQNVWEKDRKGFIERASVLQWPLFVKPVHLGSSIAITKVKDRSELEQALEVASHYDNKVLVEESVENLIEVTLPIMGNDILTPASIERPLNKTEFFNFEDKYLSGGKKGSDSGVNNNYSEIPANIPPDLSKEVLKLGKAVYKVLGCTGIARVDFLIDSKTNQVFVNEVNTLPGSLYHHNWKASGVSNVDLIQKLIQLAEERFAKDQKVVRTFESSLLKSL